MMEILHARLCDGEGCPLRHVRQGLPLGDDQADHTCRGCGEYTPWAQLTGLVGAERLCRRCRLPEIPHPRGSPEDGWTKVWHWRVDDRPAGNFHAANLRQALLGAYLDVHPLKRPVKVVYGFYRIPLALLGLRTPWDEDEE